MFMSSINREVLSEVIYFPSNVTIPMTEPIRLYNFLPRTLDYFHTYMGTMTLHDRPWVSTCKAKVIWIDVDEALNIHPGVLEKIC